jgi:hypothetical protein
MELQDKYTELYKELLKGYELDPGTDKNDTAKHVFFLDLKVVNEHFKMFNPSA